LNSVHVVQEKQPAIVLIVVNLFAMIIHFITTTKKVNAVIVAM